MFKYVLIALTLFSSSAYSSDIEKEAIPIEAQERFDLVVRSCKENKEFNNHTPVPELDGFFKRDFAFIRSELDTQVKKEERSLNKIKIFKKELIKLENWVDENHKSKLTFCTYGIIGHYLCLLLSHEKNFEEFLTGKYTKNDEENVEKEENNSDISDKFKNFLNTYEKLSITKIDHKKILKESLKYNLEFIKNKEYFELEASFIYLRSKAIIIPHISKTGLVPESVIVQSRGFYGDGDNAYGAIFLGVGINSELEYDGHKGKNSISFFDHDLRHADYSELLDDLSRVEDTAKLNKTLNEKELKNRKKTEKILFDVFFESETDVSPQQLLQYLEDYNSNNFLCNLIENTFKEAGEEIRTELLGILKDLFSNQKK